MAILEHEGPRTRVADLLGGLVERGAPYGAALEAALGCRLRVLGGDELADKRDMALPIVPRTDLLGWLQSDVPVAEATTELAECLEYGARVIGIELVRKRAAREARWSFEAELLAELIAAGGTISDHLQQRARHAGFDLTRRWRILLLDIDGGSPPPVGLVVGARRSAIAGERSMSCSLAERLAVAVCIDSDDVCEASCAICTASRGAWERRHAWA